MKKNSDHSYVSAHRIRMHLFFEELFQFFFQNIEKVFSSFRYFTGNDLRFSDARWKNETNSCYQDKMVVCLV